MDLNEFIVTHRIGQGDFLQTRGILCMDGFQVSVQAGEYYHSYPKNNDGPYEEVECMFYGDVSDIPELEQHYNDPVYSAVPIKLVESIIEKHGGISTLM